MFYVYQLIDPRDKKPFYIGKGQRGRLDHHEYEARKGKRSKKCRRIRDIWALKLEIGKEIVKNFEDEIEAYDYEAKLIEEIGLSNLTNVIPGGLGALSSNVRRLRETRKTLDKLNRIVDRIDWWEERGYELYFPMIPNGRESAKRFIECVRELQNDLRRKLNIVAVITLPIIQMGNTEKWASLPAIRAADLKDRETGAHNVLLRSLRPQLSQ